MKPLITLLISVLVTYSSYSQALKQYPIGNSGCSASFYCDPGTFEHTQNQYSKDVYSGKCSEGGMRFGLICFKLKKRIKNMEKGEEFLMAYLDSLKSTFDVISASGYGKGQRLRSVQDTRGVLDYWKTKNHETLKIKCWTDGKYIGFMYVAANNFPNEYYADAFLSGLLFPGM